MLQSVHGGFLNRFELPRVKIVLDVSKGTDHQGIPTDPGQAPTRHIKRFRHAVNLYPHILCTGDGEKAQWFAFEDQSCVGRVLHYQEMMLPGKINYLGEELTRRYGSSGVVRIVQQEYFGARQILGCEALEIRQVVVLFA